MFGLPCEECRRNDKAIAEHRECLLISVSMLIGFLLGTLISLIPS